MKTSDGRFIEKRIRMPPKITEELFKDYKKIKGFTWASLAKDLGVCDYTIRQDWMKKGNTVPLSIINKIIKAHPTLKLKDIKCKIKILDEFWGQRIGKRRLNILEGTINIQKTQEEKYAEFYGIMLGDGCVFSNLSGICISGSSVVDKDYIKNYMSSLIEDLFQIRPKIYYSKQSNSMRCFVYSTTLAKFFIKEGFPKGKKKFGNPTIPSKFFKKPELLKACIRGLNDTDGGLSPHPHTKITLHISITAQSLLKSTIKALEKLKVPFGWYKNGINIYGSKKLKKYFDVIGSSNMKNVLKYNTFIKKGFVPINKRIGIFLKRKGLYNFKLPYHGPKVS